MEKLRLLAKRTVLGSLVILQICFYPALSYADTVAPATTTAPQQTATVPTSETTPAPSTTSTAPTATTTTTPTATEAVSEKPEKAEKAEKPEQSDPTSAARKAKHQAKKTAKLAAAQAALAPTTTLPTSTSAIPTGNQINLNGTNTSAIDLNNTSGATNNLNSIALTGDAKVHDNTYAGDATSGNALVQATLLNMLQSQSNALGAGPVKTFTTDIKGDVVGDLVIDPGQLTTVRSNLLNASDIQVTDQAAINNNIDLNALSGNATVHDNNHAGSATSGNANAVANVVNVLNSVITAGGSFFGTVNIYGNLQGDILLPPHVLEKALASNSIPTTTLTITNDMNADLNNTQAINNHITTAAATGDAKVHDNNQAGNATSGNAKTNLTVLNLTGHDVVAANTLLVFVNVLGKWVGVLMDAPAGSTAAALGGGVLQNNVANQANVAATNDQQINNNILVNAQSGNATVHDNNHAGNATSGNATASANVANIANSEFNLSSWFGVLFINVFGTWNGSFGIDTAMGDPVHNPGLGGRGAGAHVGLSAPPKVFRFIPNSGSSNSGSGGSGYRVVPLVAADQGTRGGSNSLSGSATTAATTAAQGSAPATLGTATTAKTGLTLNKDDGQDSSKFDWVLASTGIGLALAILAVERSITITQNRRR